MADALLSWLHFGDLHITRAGEQNHADLVALIDVANQHLAGRISFAILPGDNADDGTEAQFRLVRDAIEKLSIPLRILPGDHDFHNRTLDAFYAVLDAPRLPKAIAADGHRCLFLDIVSLGTGGLDFRLDDAHFDWMQIELEHADTAGERSLVFMHAYPADLRAGGERLRSLLAPYHVACVDMGHTHYNELANDGRTIFMATRSTGQIEEGPIGFSVAAIDAGVISWRFAPLAGDWPLVLITRPEDHRLISDPGSPDQVVHQALVIRAKLWSGSGIAGATARIDNGKPIAVVADPADPSLWHASEDVFGLPDGHHALMVEAQDNACRTGNDVIAFVVHRDGQCASPPRHADGSDRDAIGVWPAKGLLGTQFGPNRNGREW